MVLWDFKTDGWPPVPISKASPRPRSPWIEQRLGHAAAMAAAMVLWDFKTDGWPPVPISKASPRPGSPWIELRLALAMLRQWFYGISAGAGHSPAAAMVLLDFGWHPVWFYGISKLTHAPCPDLKGLPAPKISLD